MNKTETKTIVFKGIERVNERFNANDGACEEIINLRPEGNTWKNIGKRTQITKNGLSLSGGGDYQIIIHPSSKHKYIIIKTEKRVSLYDVLSEKKVKDILKGNVLSVSYLDNILIICTDKHKYFFLWDETKQEYQDLSFNAMRADVTAKSLPIGDKSEKDSRKNAGMSDQQNFYVHTFNKINKLYPIYSFNRGELQASIDFDNVKNATKATLGYLEEYLRSKSQSSASTPYELKMKQKYKVSYNESFYGLSFYRVAFKMTDGNYINYSNITFADTNGDDVSSAGSSINRFPVTFIVKSEDRKKYDSINEFNEPMYTDMVAVYNPFGFHLITIDLSKDFNQIKALLDNDIILSIDLFMTRPIFSIDLDKNIRITNRDIKIDKSGININGQTTRYAGGYFTGDFPKNNEAIKEQLLKGTYYKVKSYTKQDIEKIKDGIITFVTKNEHIESLESNETLPTPTTDNEVLFTNAYTYNQKQHLYDIYYNIFQGYDLPLDNPTDDGAFDALVSAINHPQQADGLYYVIKGEYNNNTFAVKHKINNPNTFIKTSLTAFYLHLPKFFSYPLNDKVTFEIYLFFKNADSLLLYSNSFDNIFAGGNTNFICDVDKSKFFTKSRNVISTPYDFNEYNQTLTFSCKNVDDSDRDSFFKSFEPDIDLSEIVFRPFQTIAQTHNKNILQLTETDNPFVLPNVENYIFGERDNQIVTICNNSGFITDRNFGVFPLYVFCKDGIYALQVGNGNVAYSNLIKLNDIQIINPNVISPAGKGVIFLSKGGLCILNGRSVEILSRFMNGTPTVTNDDNINYIKLLSDKLMITPKGVDKDLSAVINRFTLSALNSNFLDEIKDSQMYFDRTHNEVCIIVKRRYSYVLNLDLMIFYKRSDWFKVENSNILSLTDEEFSTSQTDPYGRQTILTPPKTTIHLYSVDEIKDNTADICKSIVIITKPFALDTRQYKIIERIIFNLAYKDSDDFYLFIFGSRDGVNYKIVKKAIHHTMAGESYFQDVFLEMITSQFKFAFIWISGRDFTDTRIANTTFQFKQSRISGIR